MATNEHALRSECSGFAQRGRSRWMHTPHTPAFSQSFGFWAPAQTTLHSAPEGLRATPFPVFQVAPPTAGWRVPSSTRSCLRATGWRSPWTVMMRCKLGLFLGPLGLDLPAACFVSRLPLMKKLPDLCTCTHTPVGVTTKPDLQGFSKLGLLCNGQGHELASHRRPGDDSCEGWYEEDEPRQKRSEINWWNYSWISKCMDKQKINGVEISELLH